MILAALLGGPALAGCSSSNAGSPTGDATGSATGTSGSATGMTGVDTTGSETNGSAGTTAGPATGSTSSTGSSGQTTSNDAGTAGSSIAYQGTLEKFVVAPNHDFIVAGSAITIMPSGASGSHALSRFTSDGHQKWATNPPDSAGNWDPNMVSAVAASVADLAVTANDEIFVVGGNAIGNTDAGMSRTQYLAKFDADGKLLWGKPLAGDPRASNLPNAEYVAVDAAGNAVVFVYTHMPGTAPGTLAPSHLQKYGPDGTMLWDDEVDIADVTTGQPIATSPELLATDDAGDVYLHAQGPTPNSPNDGGPVAKFYLQKFSPDGRLLWQSGTDVGGWIAAAPDGSRLYGTSGFGVIAIDGNKGTVEWSKGLTTANCADASTCSDETSGISVAVVDGNAVISGMTQGILLDQTDVTEPKSTTAIAMSCDPDGNILWAHQFAEGMAASGTFYSAIRFVSNVAAGPPGAAFLFAGGPISGRIYSLLP